METDEQKLQRQMAELKGYEPPADDVSVQGSAAWLDARCGKVTASNFRHVMDVTKAGKPSAKRDGYLWDVVVERITGRPVEHFVNDAMAHGTEMEPLARIAYENRTGNMVMETGFINHVKVPGVGGSPDGVIDDDGMIEIKAPTSKTHLKIVLTGDISEYVPQMQGLMWVTGRQWCDFISFDNRLPPSLHLYIQRVKRDDNYIAELAGNVLKFLSEVDALHQALLKIGAATVVVAKAEDEPTDAGDLSSAPSISNQI